MLVEEKCRLVFRGAAAPDRVEPAMAERVHLDGDHLKAQNWFDRHEDRRTEAAGETEPGHIIVTPLSRLANLAGVAAGRGGILRTFGVALAGALLFSGRLMGDAEAAEAFPAGGRIVATYDVAVAGFSLGELHLDARFEGPAYKMKGEGKFSLFLVKTYKSEGTAASTGRLRNQGPEPASFTVNYESGDKNEERRISFKSGDVKDFDIIPPKKAGKKRVPVTTQQLRDVLDPLSAAFLHMQSGDSVCDDTMPVFDGRLRYDIVLQPKRIDNLPSEAPRGLSGPVQVCAVKFVPVSGHKPDNPAIKYLSKTDRIEARLVRLPETSLYVPLWIGVPTIIGSAAVTLTGLKFQ
jgi:hypothetical protein